jgi:AraC-like DNA-binding protein
MSASVDLLNQRLPIPEDLKGIKSYVTAFERQQCIDLKTRGWSSRDIAKEVNLSEQTVRRLIRAAVEEARAEEKETIFERYHLQDARIEYLIKYVMGYINAAQEFNADLIRSAVALFDRQAKLHGLDKQKTAGSLDWLAAAPPDELVRLARERGITLPEKFDLPQRMDA